MLISNKLLLLKEEVEVRAEGSREKEKVIVDPKVRGELGAGSVENQGISKSIETRTKG